MSEASQGVRELLEGLAEGLAQVLESMAEQRPKTAWEAAAGTLAELAPGDDAGMMWWQQKFQVLPQPAIWVGAPHAAWEDLGGRTLRAAGVDEVEPDDARSTWQEILSQALGSVARQLTAQLGQEVTCSEGVEQAPAATSTGLFRIVLSYDAPLPPLLVLLGEGLVERLDGAPDASESEAASVTQRSAAGAGVGRTMELLLDVELPVSLSFGRSQVPLKEVLKLTTGSIVELNRGVSEPVDVLVNQCLIARGEVVVVDGNYAVRIQQIVSPQERLRSVR